VLEGIAISGGVDSMALAFLCARALSSYPVNFRVSDHPVSSFHGIVVDHGLRENSADEAASVIRTVREHMRMDCSMHKLRWKDFLRDGVTHPSELSNFESLARRLRFRKIGLLLRSRETVSLLLAHHEDDQYETVLMRLMAGHGIRGLRGIRAQNDIPECHDIHVTYQSGFLDDRSAKNPYWTTNLTRVQKKQLKRQLKSEIDPEVLAQEFYQGVRADAEYSYLEDVFDASVKSSRWAPPLAPIDMEDGGVHVYRPLLGFSKDRLIATCQENKIPWFEDASNSDATLTPRNALRRMIKHHQLPAALQKPAILRLSARCTKRLTDLDAEVERLVQRGLAANFRPNTGTAVVQLPAFAPPRPYHRARRLSSHRILRLKHYRNIAAEVVRRMIGLVAPDSGQLPTPVTQPWVIDRLFPSLVLDTKEAGAQQSQAQPPKAFSLTHAYFIPLLSTGQQQQQQQQQQQSRCQRRPARWFLTRAPYPTNVPPPEVTFPCLSLQSRWRSSPGKWAWSRWRPFRLWDGRFWVRLRTRLDVRLRIAPFTQEHAKPFREALQDDGARAYLAAMLRRYAPGKVRYTLPGIYVVGKDTAVLDGEDQAYWRPIGGLDMNISNDRGERLPAHCLPLPDWVKHPPVPPAGPPPADTFTVPSGLRGTSQADLWMHDMHWEWARKEAAGVETGRLLALPTLGVHIPGTEKWMQYQTRYRKVDAALLENGVLADGEADGSGAKGPPRRRGRGRGRRGSLPRES
jgi:tRNA(Ile)-lysidine synthase